MQQSAAPRFIAWGRLARVLRRSRALSRRDLAAGLLGLAPALRAAFLQDHVRWPLWVPVAFGIGILAYFSLPFEPSPQLLAVFGLGVVAAAHAAWRRRRERHGPPADPVRFCQIGLALVLAGFVTAQLRTLSVAAPVLPRAGVYTLEGTIRDAEPRNAGQRLLLEDLAVERIGEEAVPGLVRVTIRAVDPPLLPGERIRLRAQLQPPSGPAVPGAFDFARHAFFQGIGGVGFSLGAPERLAPAVVGARPVAALRFAIANRIERVLPGVSGAITAALFTGLRASIPEQVWTDMQISGLVHIVSISGLHMTLIAGTVFLASRFLFSLWPALALRVEPKKPAAVVGIVAAGFYLLLGGTNAPTLRAFITTAVAFLAILFNRNPISMRLLAYAALIVLVLAPENLLGPSFQMSFAATLGLIAYYERRLKSEAGQGPPRRDRGMLGAFVFYFLGVAMTTLIASATTTPFAAYHFQNVATYGTLSNLIAVPLTAFWIMPLGLFALLLMPFGLDAPVLMLVGIGVDWMVAIAAFAAGLPGAGIRVPAWPPSGLLLLVAGGLWLCLWRQRWRHLGWLPCGLGLAVVLAADSPDLVIDRRGDLVMLRTATGEVLRLDRVRDNWLAGQMLDVMAAAQALPWPVAGTGSADGALACDAAGCVLRHGQGRPLALALTAEAVAEDCRHAAFVVILTGPESCANGTPSLGSRALWRTGGLALRLDGETVRLTSVIAGSGGGSGRRPWSR